MKKIILILCMFFAIKANAKTNNNICDTTIIIKGNCGQCQDRIQEAAFNLKGVKLAEWNKKTKILHIVFYKNKCTLQQIEKAIASAGHDTPNNIATNEAYKKLPACCAYRSGNSCTH